jgi:hypothetical protein
VENGTISFADLYNVVPLGGDSLDSSALGYPLLTTYIKAADIYHAIGVSISMGMFSGNSDYYINFAGIYVVLGGTAHGTSYGYDVYLCPPETNSSSPNYGMPNGNIPYATGTLLSPSNTTTVYKIAVDLYTLMMMYEVASLYPTYTIYTYPSTGGTTLDDYVNSIHPAISYRVYTSTSGTTLRGWQAMEAWSWAASAHAKSNLSVLPAGSGGGFGYTASLPYKRIQ